MMRWLAAIGVSCGVLFGAGAAQAAMIADPSETLIALVNETRAGNGAAPVVGASGVQAVAQAWAERLAETGALEHNPDTSAQLPVGWSSWGENVAAGGGSLSPEAMNDLWNNSPGHHANIVNPDYTVLGVGYAVAADGTAYGVEVFARYDDPAQAGAEPAAPLDYVAPTESDDAPEEPATEGPAAEEITDSAASPAPDAAAAPSPGRADDPSPKPSASGAVGAAPAASSPTRALPPLLIALAAASVLCAAVSIMAFVLVARSRRARTTEAAVPEGTTASVSAV